MKNSKVSITCAGCGESFLVSPSRATKANFCSTLCYKSNQHKRRGSQLSRVASSAMPGHRFGRLTVVGRVVGTGKFLCKCDCGGEGRYNKNLLESGGIVSCGCYNREKCRIAGPDAAWAAWCRYLRSQSSHRLLVFELTDERIEQLCSSACSYCGIAPQPWEGAKRQYVASSLSKKCTPDMEFAETKIIHINGLDRIDSNLGYTETNVAPCCETCNKAKLAMPLDVFKQWVTKVYNHLVINGGRNTEYKHTK